MALRVEVLPIASLGNRSYAVHDGVHALVIDPPRDVDLVTSLLAARSLNCAGVLETHIHNDYLSGGATLAASHDVPLLVNAADPVRFDRTPVRDGDELRVGPGTVGVIATPGHTDTHLAYLVGDGAGPDELFTGGSLLRGSVGRTDLVDPARSLELARAQYRSVRRLGLLPEATRVRPTHGFGSFCAAGGACAATDDVVTVGEESRSNATLLSSDEHAFARELVAGLGPYPRYYAQMAGLNLAGAAPAPLDLPPVVNPATMARAGAWVVDLRSRRAHAQGHLPGAVAIELGDSFATYVGWLLPWGASLVLVADDVEQVREARRQLARIGYDGVDGYWLATDHPGSQTVPLRTFEDYRHRRNRGEQSVLLDVRQAAEYDELPLTGAVHIPLHDLPHRLDELDDGEIWVHCRSGFRATIAGSLLQRAGRRVVVIDDQVDVARELGLAGGVRVGV